MRAPNARMKSDVLAVADPLQVFSVSILETTTSKDMADYYETSHMLSSGCLGPGGYNTLKRSGTTSAKFRFLSDKGLV